MSSYTRVKGITEKVGGFIDRYNYKERGIELSRGYRSKERGKGFIRNITKERGFLRFLRI